MSRIQWGQEDRLYEYGIDRGVLYILGVGAVPWDGLTSAEEIVDGGEVTSHYFDGRKTLDSTSSEDFQLHVQAYFYPEEFEDLEARFNFTYRTRNGQGYKLHLVYNAVVAPTGQSHQTQTDVVNLTDFGWDFHTVPTDVPSAKATAHLVVDSLESNAMALSELEDVLYGTPTSSPHFPTAPEVIAIFGYRAVLVVTVYPDGTWTAVGPDDMVHMLDDTSFEIVSPSVVYTTSDTYDVSNY